MLKMKLMAGAAAFAMMVTAQSAAWAQTGTTQQEQAVEQPPVPAVEPVQEEQQAEPAPQEQAPPLEPVQQEQQAEPVQQEQAPPPEPVQQEQQAEPAQQEQAPVTEQQQQEQQAEPVQQEQAPAAEQQQEQQAEPAQQEQAPAAEQQAEDPAQQPQQQPVAEDPKPAFTAESVLGDERAAAEMADADLRERIRAAEELAASDQTPRRQRRQLQEKLAADQAELNARIAASTGVAVQNIDVSSKAGEITGDSRKAADLSDDELRERIQQTRGLLALEELSDDQTQALRQVLDNDRAEIRSRVAARDTDQRRARRDDDSDGGNRSDELPMRGDQLTLRDLLEDDRPADDLTTDALERRIDANRRALRLDNLNDRQRTSLRERMRDDRQALRGRLGDRRERRRARLDDPAFALAVAVGAIATAAILSRPNIAAAEAYDEEIEDWLTAAPLVETERRYRFEDFRDQPRLRYAVPGIEVDTVRFGFGEGFLREEEIPKLDRIGATIERIVAGNPDEVFMIEGHTDAVGTEAANMKLSEERAEAVKQALLEYFNIGEENLVTVGRGELYPKIPTQAAEAENRRVSVRRITPLLARN
jgi:outer membrane protein OmpA-like peptidoglycan-associated protein